MKFHRGQKKSPNCREKWFIFFAIPTIWLTYVPKSLEGYAAYPKFKAMDSLTFPIEQIENEEIIRKFFHKSRAQNPAYLPEADSVVFWG